MENKKFNYYEAELKKLVKSDYPMSIKIYDGEGNSTRQFNLNEESIEILIEFFKKHVNKTD